MKDLLPNMNDDELDKLFRKASEENDAANSSKISFERKEEAWEKLQEKLDAPPPPSMEGNTGKSKNTWKFLSLILLLILAGTIIWLVGEKNHPRSSSSLSTNQQLSHTDIIDQTHNEALIKHNIQPAHLMTPPSNTALKNNIAVSSGVKNMNSPYPGYSAPFKPQSFAFQPERVQYLPMISGNKTGIKNIKLPGATDLSRSFLPISSPPNSPKAGTTTTGSLPMSSSHKQPNLKIPHWYLGISLGPEWSSASGEGWGTGVAGGIMLNYRLNNKWIFETGISAAKKIYTALPYDYNPPDNSWRNYNVESINANCLLIDIPLNVNYVIWSNTKHIIYGGAGLSSTLMHHEAYTYNIKTYGGGYTQYEDEMYNKERHLFSLLNLSAGYERTWNRFSFGAEPYVKIPLTGIGYGRVKLFSTGIQFTLKYSLK